jgi:hypothetical protein
MAHNGDDATTASATRLSITTRGWKNRRIPSFQPPTFSSFPTLSSEHHCIDHEVCSSSMESTGADSDYMPEFGLSGAGSLATSLPTTPKTIVAPTPSPFLQRGGAASFAQLLQNATLDDEDDCSQVQSGQHTLVTDDASTEDDDNDDAGSEGAAKGSMQEWRFDGGGLSWPQAVCPKPLDGRREFMAVRNTFIDIRSPPCTPQPGALPRARSLPRSAGWCRAD